MKHVEITKLVIIEFLKNFIRCLDNFLIFSVYSMGGPGSILTIFMCSLINYSGSEICS